MPGQTPSSNTPSSSEAQIPPPTPHASYSTAELTAAHALLALQASPTAQLPSQSANPPQNGFPLHPSALTNPPPLSSHPWLRSSPPSNPSLPPSQRHVLRPLSHSQATSQNGLRDQPDCFTLSFPGRIWNACEPPTRPHTNHKRKALSDPKTAHLPTRRSPRETRLPQRFREESEDRAPRRGRNWPGENAGGEEGVRSACSSVTVSEEEGRNSSAEGNQEGELGNGGAGEGEGLRRSASSATLSGEESGDGGGEEDGRGDEQGRDGCAEGDQEGEEDPALEQMERDAIMALMNMRRQREWEARGETWGFVWESLSPWVWKSEEWRSMI